MMTLVRDCPLRVALLIATMIALPVLMFSAWPQTGIVAALFIAQAVDLARLRGLEPENDPAAPHNRRTR